MENNLLIKIQEALKEKVNIKVPFVTFLKLWNPKNDGELTKKLLSFSKTNNLDYVIILEKVNNPTFVRFWKREYSKPQLELKADSIITEGE